MNAVNKLGATPLHTACAAGCTTCVTALLEAGASLTATTKLGLLPLNAAQVSRSAAVQELLVARGADVEAAAAAALKRTDWPRRQPRRITVTMRVVLLRRVRRFLPRLHRLASEVWWRWMACL